MRYLSNKFIWIMQAAVIVTLMVCVQSFAGNSWLDKGSELLKSFGGSDKISALTVEEIGSGLKEALKVGSQNVVSQLGATDGFNNDANIHIPLPASLDKVKFMLGKVGMSSLFEDLELKLNRAAEVATPRAKQLFVDAISMMTLQDVNEIYNGPDDAATQYFKGKMSPQLADEMKPVIDTSLSEVGAVKAYDNMMKEYKSLPFVPDIKANLTDHVVEKGMDGIFYYMAKEEAAIRQNPAKRTTELLKKVFNK
ncbi:DUF4197 domain-containing protein [Desulfobacula toluolica]|uniref:Conserved uncharacterized protein n=1 Tax=Desulfobacula toluolica (strain DSM 7467 / Tol2) TaxID=651182 RepID=K0NBW1_DESTT|nr:DUF4197 domain-containing protein [Desulfobacula toluolica]CCK81934.1 conserved uncharacterized protein [Desulfobacula toluolica Tol2]